MNYNRDNAVSNVSNADATKDADRPLSESVETIEVRIPASPRYVVVAREAADGVSELMHLSVADAAAVRLAVGEACNNAVFYSHAEGAAKPPVVHITFRLAPESLEVDVVNPGSGFLPGHGSKMPDPMSESGRGLALIEAMMDTVEFIGKGGRTMVRMRKMRPAH